MTNPDGIILLKASSQGNAQAANIAMAADGFYFIPHTGPWILDTGVWNDAGSWIDTAVWNDGV